MLRARWVFLLLTIACFHSSVRPYEGIVIPVSRNGLARGPMAVVPIRLPDDVEMPESTAAVLDSLVAATLVEGGLPIIPAAHYSAIWQRLAEEAGGFYDQFTGQRDDAKYDAAVSALYREMDSLHAPRAWLYPEVWVVEAEVADGMAHWDGVAQRAGTGWYTTLLALTFEVSVEDTSGVAVFRNGRGLELIERLGALGEIESIAPSRLFQNPTRTSLVVRSVLNPLVAIADTTS